MHMSLGVVAVLSEPVLNAPLFKQREKGLKRLKKESSAY